MWTGRIYFLAKGGGFEQFIVLMTFAVQKTLCLVSALFAGLILSSCSSSQQQVEAPARLPAYSFVPGKTAVLHNGKAIPPRNAPVQVKRAIAAANSLVNKPYRMGGGHRKHYDTHYDCSGSTSFVLKEAGLLTSPAIPSCSLITGRKGPGTGSLFMPRTGTFFWSSAASGLTLPAAAGAAKARAGGWTAGTPGTSWCAIPRDFNPSSAVSDRVFCVCSHGLS